MFDFLKVKDSIETVPRRTYLRLQSNVQIAPLVKRIFRETYGVEDDELYHNDELCKKISGAVKSLRLSYQNNVCVTDYGAEENRKAYMIAYYPYFIAPAAYVTANCLKPNISKSVGNWAFFASGPCPELLGVAQSITPPHTQRVITLDLEQNWFPYQKITRKLCEEALSFKSALMSYTGFNIGDHLPSGSKCREDVSNANIFFMQNYLSHLSPATEHINKFLAWFSAWVNEAKDGACFAFIDLNYGSTNEVFNRLGEKNFLWQNGLKIIDAHIPAFGNPLEIHHSDTTPAIGEKIFTGEYGLAKRFLTKFYFVVLKKSLRLNISKEELASLTDDELLGLC